MKRFWSLVQKIVFTLAVGAILGSICFAQTTKKEIDFFSYKKTELPKETTKLWLTDGNTQSDTVIIFCQGGPDKSLAFEEHGKSSLRYLPKYKEYQIAYLHQAQTFNTEMFNYQGDFTSEMAEKEVANTSEILFRAIKYFKNKKKKVIVIGNSYGAYVVTNYLATKPSLADKYIIVAGRIDDGVEAVRQHQKGLTGGYDETGKTFIFSDTDPTKLEESARRKYRVKQLLKWAVGNPRYSKLLADKDLSNVTYFYAANDQNVGQLTKRELEFLKFKNVAVYLTSDGHSDTFYRFIDAVSDGKLEL